MFQASKSRTVPCNIASYPMFNMIEPLGSTGQETTISHFARDNSAHNLPIMTG